MGNKNKSITWLASTPFRIRGFAREVASKCYGHNPLTKIIASDFEVALSEHPNAIDISSPTLRNWENGKVFPSKYNQKLIDKAFPNSSLILNTNDCSNSLNRFLGSLDISGSLQSSSLRAQDITRGEISAGACLKAIAESWGPRQTKDGGYYIPKLKCSIPSAIDHFKYRAYDRYCILSFMFECGAYLNFNNEESFVDWAIDLASTAAVVTASIDGMSPSDQSLSGDIRDLSNFLYNVFFTSHREMQLEEIERKLKTEFPTLFNGTTVKYADRLISAREALKEALSSLGCDLSIVNKVNNSVKREF